jgi:hypothetical protein
MTVSELMWQCALGVIVGLLAGGIAGLLMWLLSIRTPSQAPPLHFGVIDPQLCDDMKRAQEGDREALIRIIQRTFPPSR